MRAAKKNQSAHAQPTLHTPDLKPSNPLSSWLTLRQVKLITGATGERIQQIVLSWLQSGLAKQEVTGAYLVDPSIVSLLLKDKISEQPADPNARPLSLFEISDKLRTADALIEQLCRHSSEVVATLERVPTVKPIREQLSIISTIADYARRNLAMRAVDLRRDLLHAAQATRREGGRA